jgi:hypothetical protein
LKEKLDVSRMHSIDDADRHWRVLDERAIRPRPENVWCEQQDEGMVPERKSKEN